MSAPTTQMNKRPNNNSEDGARGRGAEQLKEAVERFAPSEAAAGWDNTGILIDSTQSAVPAASHGPPVALLTIDLTPAVLDEAIQLGVSVILAYHPVIFHPLKRLDDPLLVGCIGHGISVYSPHTQLDPLMNDYIRRLALDGDKTTTARGALDRLKKAVDMEHIRVVNIQDGAFKEEDVVVGVGAAFRDPTFRDKLIITGEMSHHDMLKCKRLGCTAILLEHSNSERPFLGRLKQLLEADEDLKGWSILLSAQDRDPVEFL